MRAGNQAYAVVASDDKGSCLAAWSDVRPQPDKPQAEVYALFGTLLRDGKPAESAGHELGRAPASILAPAVAWDGAGYVVIAGRGSDGFSANEPFAVTVGTDGKAQPVPIRFGYSYSLAADPAARKTLVWFNHRREHGAYSTQYGTGIYMGGKLTGGSRVLGLQSAYAPQNEQWCAAAFDGRNFVAVVEQSPDCEDAGIFKSLPATVELAATRIDPASGKPLDAAPGRSISARTRNPGARIWTGPPKRSAWPASPRCNSAIRQSPRSAPADRCWCTRATVASSGSKFTACCWTPWKIRDIGSDATAHLENVRAECREPGASASCPRHCLSRAAARARMKASGLSCASVTAKRRLPAVRHDSP